MDQAQRAALASRRLADILQLLELSKVIWGLEGHLLERTGILAAHPDGLDRDLYSYVNASVFVRS